MNIIYSTVNTLRDKYAPVTSKSTFRQTGQITPEEFVTAGDYLVFKFPTWSWGDAEPISKRVSYLPPGKQFLVTRDVLCRRRANDLVGDAAAETLVKDGGGLHPGDDDEVGWLRTGDLSTSAGALKVKRDASTQHQSKTTLADSEEEEIPDMEDDDDEEAIIPSDGGHAINRGDRTYNLYIAYSNYYRTPRLYLSGYLRSGEPLQPKLMMDDIVGDYKDKTVTLEDFPHFDSGSKMATIHPCKHASVMKLLLDRADAGLKLQREKLKSGKKSVHGIDNLTEGVFSMALSGDSGKGAPADAPDGWEEVSGDELDDGEVALRVDQYMVVFLKFMASVTPSIEHDNTMGV